MSVKNFFIGFIVFVILIVPTKTYAEQFYTQYPGNCFQPRMDAQSYVKYYEGYLRHNDTADEYYFCPVNFNVPDGSPYFIKSIGIRYEDVIIDGHLEVELRRKNLYTGAIHTVATWQSGHSGTGSGSASKGTNAGFKLIDSKKFCYWLVVRFYKDGDFNPFLHLTLHQVRIHYGT